MTPFIDTVVQDPESYDTEYFVTPAEVPVYPRRRPPKRPGRFGRHAIAIIAGVVLLVVPLAILIATLVLHNVRTEPRAAMSLVGREIREGILLPGERILHAIPVYQRSGADYFRATQGELVMTEDRLIYVGLLPRDVFAGGREPDVFERAVFPIDTTVTVRAGRAMLGVARAVAVVEEGERTTLVVPRDEWDAAEAMLASVGERHAADRAEAARALAELRAAEEAAKRPIYHTVARGEALITIARQYGISVERLQELNGMSDTRIRIGQTLLVKPDER